MKVILFFVLLPVRILATILVLAVAIPMWVVLALSWVEAGVVSFALVWEYLIPRIWGKKVSLQGLRAQELTTPR